jgi:valyl-tRNA synthetase
VPPRGDTTGDGELRFFPERYARTYHAWHEGIRDWCISRQLWWGHQIPVWVRIVPLADAAPEVLEAGRRSTRWRPGRLRWVDAGAAHLARKVTEDEVEEAVCVPPDSTLRRLPRADDSSMDEPTLVAALEADGFTRDPDVLDTWFSSGLWPTVHDGLAVARGLPRDRGPARAFNPTSVLMTAREIITLWVSRMVMFNRYFLDGQLRSPTCSSTP